MNKIYLNKDLFSRLFVLAKKQKINLRSFSLLLANNDNLVLSDENDNVISLIDLFNSITGLYLDSDDSFGIYNDAYWCGTVYYYLYFKTKKSLSYIIYKFPLDQLIEFYGTYHEMDYSSVYDLFLSKEKENPLLRSLCKQNGITVNELHERTGISINTLQKYYRDDELLLSASFQNIYKISQALNVNISLFAK